MLEIRIIVEVRDLTGVTPRQGTGHARNGHPGLRILGADLLERMHQAFADLEGESRSVMLKNVASILHVSINTLRSAMIEQGLPLPGERPMRTLHRLYDEWREKPKTHDD